MDKQKIKKLALQGVVGLGLLALGYGVGAVQGAVSKARVEANLRESNEQAARQLRQQITSITERNDRCSERMAKLSRHLDELEARRQLDHALHSLDDRNFGIAQGHLEKAVSLLRPEKGRDVPADEPYRELAATIQQNKIVVAGNLSDQRSRVASHLSQLDRLLDQEREPRAAGTEPQ